MTKFPGYRGWEAMERENQRALKCGNIKECGKNKNDFYF